VQDNQKVAAGQVLARIDDRDFKVALDQAAADVKTAEAALLNIDAQLAQQRSAIEQERADIVQDEASLSYAKVDNVRYDQLMKTGYGTVQRAQQADTALRERTAQLSKARAGLLVAERKIDVLTTERAKAEAQRDHASAVRHQAELNLSYTTITAPVDGTVGSRALRVGQYVQAGTPLMAVVPLQAVYVVANYKETQLTDVRPGQKATVEIDTFPGVKLAGHVDSLSPASGLEFALLPPDNATGNFTKIVQRVPVKILLDDQRLAGLLRPGMSVEPTIDTRR
jgi:membrane fusion protein (multidrug efflux system)